jgi:hypothetical protein
MLLVQHLVRTLAGRLEVDGGPPGARFTLHLGHGTGHRESESMGGRGAPCA